MTEPPISTELIRDVLWRRVDETSLEHCRLSRVPGAFTLQGSVLTVVDARPFQAQYLVHCRMDWSTHAVHVHTIHGESTRQLRLRRDRDGGWWRNDQRAPEFDDIMDIDLSVTPSTNTLPIRRLALDVRASAGTDALWVRFPTLTLERLRQRYTRLDEHHYSYESGNGSFRADLEVDDEGVVVRYGDLWERVSG